MSHFDDAIKETESAYDFSDSDRCKNLEERVQFCIDFLTKYESLPIKETEKITPIEVVRKVYMGASGKNTYNLRETLPYNDRHGINRAEEIRYIKKLFSGKIADEVMKLIDEQPDALKIYDSPYETEYYLQVLLPEISYGSSIPMWHTSDNMVGISYYNNGNN